MQIGHPWSWERQGLCPAGLGLGGEVASGIGREKGSPCVPGGGQLLGKGDRSSLVVVEEEEEL